MSAEFIPFHAIERASQVGAAGDLPYTGVSKMVVRLSAAVCGAAIVFACSSAAMARSEAASHAANRAAHDTSILGTASTYNPYRPGYREGGVETSSGERYDPSAWTAAIQTGLRENFGGVHGGKTRYALVEGVNKKVIVKINDVGPLEPGRIIDLNERRMCLTSIFLDLRS
jgi:rare lipoprotein A